ncbi:hypothetical protein JG687_00000943 [Phytophthora cactorum]|uniref:Uncharacterized protein n=1 Tax=Phytophthora cactorum TaxID=29920 RepID=A0A8T1UZB1_9STRA|nr:hypothetical protein JG687_00000943 [Phytophthora cactorum]
MATTGDVSGGSYRESSKRVQDNSSEVETNGGKAATSGASARAPSSSAVPTAANWQRKRSSLLLNAMHPENTRETAAFVVRLPRPTALRVLLSLFAYALLVSDVPRAGSSVDSLPFVQIEPNVFTVYGPTALPRRTIFRNGSTITNEESTISSEVSTALYKFSPSSYGLRTARDLLDTSPKLDSVFSMLDTLVEALAANAPSTTSYKNVAQTDDGIAITARDPANPGVDLCVDDLDRPLFCEKPWAASLAVDGSERDALWETVSSRAAALQKTLSKSEKLDVTLIEAESDPLTRLGGAVLLAHKIYNVVVLYRIRVCTDAGVCTTTTIFDERVEGKVLYTDALEWSSLASTLRFIGQLLSLRHSCKHGYVKVETAHIIDALILYELEDDGGESTTDSFAALTRWLAVHMRCIWLMALLARFRALLQTSAGAWTPSHGVSGVRGHLLPALALGAVAFVAHGGITVDDRDARILEANEVEPVPTFMLLRSETLDAWKMNLEGVYSDMLAVALAAIIYVVVILAARALMRWHRRRWVKPTNVSQSKPQEKGDAVPDPLFFARSAVPSAAGALWEPSCLSVSWDDDLLGPLLMMLSATTPGISQRNIDKKQGSSQENTDDNVAANGNEMATSSASTAQRMLMNLVFLSDPWNLLVLKLGRARVHLYHLRGSGLDCKVVHANAKARVAREYSLALENVELVASLRASELSWSQLVTCK